MRYLNSNLEWSEPTVVSVPDCSSTEIVVKGMDGDYHVVKGTNGKSANINGYYADLYGEPGVTNADMTYNKSSSSGVILNGYTMTVDCSIEVLRVGSDIKLISLLFEYMVIGSSIGCLLGDPFNFSISNKTKSNILFMSSANRIEKSSGKLSIEPTYRLNTNLQKINNDIQLIATNDSTLFNNSLVVIEPNKTLTITDTTKGTNKGNKSPSDFGININ